MTVRRKYAQGTALFSALGLMVLMATTPSCKSTEPAPVADSAESRVEEIVQTDGWQPRMGPPPTSAVEVGARPGAYCQMNGAEGVCAASLEEWVPAEDDEGVSLGEVCTQDDDCIAECLVYLEPPADPIPVAPFAGQFRADDPVNDAFALVPWVGDNSREKLETRPFFADLNADGLEDIVYGVGTVDDGATTIFWQEEAGVFSKPDSREELGNCVFFQDLDGDGWRDLYCKTFVQRIYWGSAEGVIWSEFTVLPDPDDAGDFVRDAAPRDLDHDGLLDLVISRWETYSELGENMVYRNLGNRTFEDVSLLWGLNTGGTTWTVQFLDYDFDGTVDLLVQNDGPNIVANTNHALRNGGPGEGGEPSFERVSYMPFGCDYHGIFACCSGPMGGVVGDVNRDLRPDFLLALSLENTFLSPDKDGKWVFPRQALQLPVPEMSKEGGVVSWCPGMWDMDADGNLDLFIPGGDDYGSADDGDRGDARILIFQGDGDGNFADIRDIGLETLGHFFTLSLTDLDGDMDLDALVGGFEQPAVLLMNELERQGNLVILELVSTSSNPHGIGAELHATVGDWERAYYVGDRSCPAISDRELISIGLGAETEVKKLRIRWPSGYVQMLHNVEGGKHHVLTEPETIRVTPETRHIAADGKGEAEVRVWPRAENGDVRAVGEVRIESPFHPEAQWSGAVKKQADGSYVRSLQSSASGGSVVIEISVDGGALPMRPRIWFD